MRKPRRIIFVQADRTTTPSPTLTSSTVDLVPEAHTPPFDPWIEVGSKSSDIVPGGGEEGSHGSRAKRYREEDDSDRDAPPQNRVEDGRAL